MRKQGSILIELVASIMIMSLTSIFIVKANIQNFKVLKERILCEKVNRTIYNVIDELKYNVKKDKIDELLTNNEIGFKYYEDFSKDLITKNIMDFQKGEDIKITKMGEDAIGLKLKIQANVKEENSEVNIEKEFTKSWWMDEIEDVY